MPLTTQELGTFYSALRHRLESGGHPAPDMATMCEWVYGDWARPQPFSPEILGRDPNLIAAMRGCAHRLGTPVLRAGCLKLCEMAEQRRRDLGLLVLEVEPPRGMAG